MLIEAARIRARSMAPLADCLHVASANLSGLSPHPLLRSSLARALEHRGERAFGQSLRRARYRDQRSQAMSGKLLDVRDLSVAFRQGESETLAVDHVSFSLDRGETLAIVGELGSGKSVSALSIPRLLNYPAAYHPSGEILLQRPRSPESERGRASRGARQRHHHGVPGADDLAQPAAHGRAPDRRDPGAAQGHRRPQGP